MLPEQAIAEPRQEKKNIHSLVHLALFSVSPFSVLKRQTGTRGAKYENERLGHTLEEKQSHTTGVNSTNRRESKQGFFFKHPDQLAKGEKGNSCLLCLVCFFFCLRHERGPS